MAGILDDTKKALGLDPSYTAFDPDIIMFINSVCSTLNQLGIGPADGFSIEDDSAGWEDLIGVDQRLNMVKTYVYLRVRLLFDPPSTSYLVDALKQQITEHEWRLNVVRESDAWVDPDPSIPQDLEDGGILDGGEP